MPKADGVKNFAAHFFIRTILYEHEVHFFSKFKNKLRTIQPQQKNKVSNFQLKK